PHEVAFGEGLLLFVGLVPEGRLEGLRKGAGAENVDGAEATRAHGAALGGEIDLEVEFVVVELVVLAELEADAGGMDFQGVVAGGGAADSRGDEGEFINRKRAHRTRKIGVGPAFRKV